MNNPLSRPTSRSENICLSCWNNITESIPTLTSAFLSERAWHGKPERTNLIQCKYCGFRFFERGLSECEAKNYYTNYRDETYLHNRSYHEWFYTRNLHLKNSEWMSSSERSRNLSETLRKSGFSSFQNVLDYGGGAGHLIANIESKCKFVFDMSEESLIDGTIKISDPSEINKGIFDCVICAQTLEHCSDPALEMDRIIQAMTPGGIVYIELPNELWRGSFSLNRVQLTILELILSGAEISPLFLKITDFIFTGIRVKFGILPFFGFVPMREHLNYFSLDAIINLVVNSGLDVLVTDNSYPFVIAKKPVRGVVSSTS